MDLEAPSFLAMYALQQLLLPEAAHRDWINGDAGALYESGIEAHMQHISTSYMNIEIDQSDIDAYIQANPLEAGRE